MPRNSVFDISRLAVGITYKYRGEALLASRRPLPVPSNDPDAKRYTLTIPMRLQDISFALYQDTGWWALLAEWNNLANPSRYLNERLPRGYAIRYLEASVFEGRYAQRLGFGLGGLGEVDVRQSGFGDALLETPVPTDTALDEIRAALEQDDLYAVQKVRLL